MKQNNSSGGGFGPVFIVMLIIGIIAAFIGSANMPHQSATFEPDRSSVEHRYVKERFKLEGYSDAESKQAADAILKFHNAQQARKR
ncbi:hypothetical protein EBZ39_01590 [bacterium]|nr:hypothetical protein [bacterium]